MSWRKSVFLTLLCLLLCLIISPFNRHNKFLYSFFILLPSPPLSLFSFFAAQMPAKYRKNKVKPRGVSNRNRGLEWIRANASDGVLYFADDDNTYDLDIFDEVRQKNKLANDFLIIANRCSCAAFVDDPDERQQQHKKKKLSPRSR
jgi:Glycosyltransferase family 43